ncbi:hypothetical protein PRUPE_6G046500 [Prunus persica]|uniref:Uncharacterized protein n=1 Tax=Prunus persica TaxID=3760 RepID=A0A251NK96_PRUPE|nr:hypothetical protein PRUPE_6G046500 [Prunus persica]
MLINKTLFWWMHKLMDEMSTEIACFGLGNVHVFPVTCPKLSRKFLEKQDATYAGLERLVQESDLSRLNYVKACAREAFRLHPIAPFNVPHVSILQHDTWDEPLKFMPERHLKEDDRLCTGMCGCVTTALGTSKTVMLFARLLHGFSWNVPPTESRIDLTE